MIALEDILQSTCQTRMLPPKPGGSVTLEIDKRNLAILCHRPFGIPPARSHVESINTFPRSDRMPGDTPGSKILSSGDVVIIRRNDPALSIAQFRQQCSHFVRMRSSRAVAMAHKINVYPKSQLWHLTTALQFCPFKSGIKSFIKYN
jgi:hypothetical protein